MNYKALILAASIMLAGNVTIAQTKVYSLEEVWQKTLNYPSLAAKSEAVQQQQLNKKLVQQQALPEVHVQAQQSYGAYQAVPGSFFPLPGIYNTSGSNRNGAAGSGSNLFASAVLQWDFMQFGRNRKNIAVADAAVTLSRADQSQEAFRLQATATRHYFTALQSAASLNVLNADVRRLADLMELLKAQSDAGLRPGADTLLIRSELLQAKTKISDQQTALETALLQLASIIGEEPGTVAVDTSLYRRFTASGGLPQNALQSHPYLNYLNAAIGYEQAQLEAVKKEVYPSVGLLAGTGVRGSGMDALGGIDKSLSAPWKNSAGSYLIGLGITWNFSSLYQNKTKQKIAASEIASIRANRTAAQLQLTTLYSAAVAGWKEQRQKLQDAQLAYSSAQQAYELYIVRYESGLINLIELLQLQKSLQDAERVYVTSLGSYWNELIEQSEALGAPSLLLNALKP